MMLMQHKKVVNKMHNNFNILNDKNKFSFLKKITTSGILISI
jgi:hypothetical protein